MTTQTDVPHLPIDALPGGAEQPATVDAPAAAEAMGERLFGGALAAMELATVHVGLRSACTRR